MHDPATTAPTMTKPRYDKQEFDLEVYDVVGQIPPGKVLSYGRIAHLIGMPGHARRVGRAMASAPHERNLPCHRVVRSDGGLVPCWPAQRTLLEKEGVAFRRSGRVDLERCGWEIPAEA